MRKSQTPTTSAAAAAAAAAFAFGLVGNSKDLVGEILNRLPLSSVMRFRLVCKEWCSLITSTQSFNIRNYSCFVVQYDSQIITIGKSPSDHFNLDDDHNSNIKMNKVVREYLRGSRGSRGGGVDKKRYYVDIKLISSYRGFLLFTAKPVMLKPVMSVLGRFRRWLTKDDNEEEEEEEEDLALILYNPVTEKQYTVAAPPRTHVYCGFYYHSPTKEYRILYQLLNEFDPYNRYHLARGTVVQFLVFSLQTQVMRVLKLQQQEEEEEEEEEEVHPAYSNKKKKKRTTRTTRRPDVDAPPYPYCYYPDPSTPPVISNGSLHWIVSEKYYPQLPHCSHTILCFGMESEEFRLMPHPKLSHPCSHYHPHHMNLLEMMDGGILCLCDGYYGGSDSSPNKPILEIYVMEDYQKWTWVRRYRVDLSNYIHDGCLYGLYYKALQILQEDQLLLHYHPHITHPYIDLTQFRCCPKEYAIYSLNQHEDGRRLRPAVASSSTVMVRKSSKKKNKRQPFQVLINEYAGVGRRLRRMIIDPKKKKRPPPIVMGNMVVLTPSLASFQHNRTSTAPGTGTFFSIRTNNRILKK